MVNFQLQGIDYRPGKLDDFGRVSGDVVVVIIAGGGDMYYHIHVSHTGNFDLKLQAQTNGFTLETLNIETQGKQ